MVAGASPAQAAEGPCTLASVNLGSCHISADNDGREVSIGGKVEVPAAPVGNNPNPVTTPEPPAVDRPGWVVTMPVTLSDLAKFRPNPGTDHMQPNGWMIVGLPTNFYAHASQHVKTGTLLGEPASVRFTPARYIWTYGDGSSRTAATPGSTWSALGLHDFDATATSHSYAHPGRYVIELTIGYSPEYRIASSTDWIPLAGYVWVPANRLVAVAASGAKTVLVEHACTTHPHGPGC
jgi:hypothetical protein